MQRLLAIIFLFVVLVNKTKGQNYHPWPKSNAQWQVNYQLFPEPPGLSASYRIPSTDFDTLINQIHYSKLFDGDNYRGSLRATGDHSKVYFIPKDSIAEYLLFDFSVKVGDTLFNVYSNFFQGVIIDNRIIYEIDSILLGSKYHKLILMHGTNEEGEIKWLEGIGGLGGLLENYPIMSVSGDFYLGCMSHNSNIYFPAYSQGDCGTVGINDNIQNYKMNIFPNPFESKLFIEGLTGQEEIKLFDFKGQCLFDRKAEFNSILDLDHLPRGIYFLKINLGHVNLVNRKVFKVH
jgi:hypothetical protein